MLFWLIIAAINVLSLCSAYYSIAKKRESQRIVRENLAHMFDDMKFKLRTKYEFGTPFVPLLPTVAKDTKKIVWLTGKLVEVTQTHEMPFNGAFTPISMSIEPVLITAESATAYKLSGEDLNHYFT